MKTQRCFPALLVCTLLSAAPAASAPHCRSPNLTIPDGNTTGVTDSMVISTEGSLADLNVVVKIDHTWVGDLIVVLSHVNTNTSVTIIDRPGRTTSGNGCGSDNIDVTLDDQAVASVENQCPPVGGTFQPNNPLSVFNGQSLAGTWTLNVSDRSAIDTGTLVQWCLLPTTEQEAWRQFYFGSPDNSGEGADDADPDGDGHDNAFEFTAGLSPIDPTSRFRLRIEAITGQPEHKTIIFSPIVAGRTYVVRSKASLLDPTWNPLTSYTTADAGDERTVTDLLGAGPMKFYHVEITRP